jgi:hypothetical protein
LKIYFLEEYRKINIFYDFEKMYIFSISIRKISIYFSKYIDIFHSSRHDGAEQFEKNKFFSSSRDFSKIDISYTKIYIFFNEI